jgi:hypothetical protein
MANTPPSPVNPEVAHEQGDVNVKAVLWFAAGLAAFAVVVHLGLAWMYFSFRAAEDREKQSAYPEEFTEGKSRLPTEPRLEGIEPRKALGQEDELDSYRWVDEQKGIVAIPIQRGFERLLTDERHKPKVRAAKEKKR